MAEDSDFLDSVYKLCHMDFETYDVFSKKYEDFLDSSNEQISKIRSVIGDDYRIDRTDFINDINVKNNRFVVVTGDSGVGKSAICKDVCLNYQNKLYIRAEELCKVENIDDLFGFPLNSFFRICNGEIIVFIDSLEFISDVVGKQGKLISLLGICRKYEKVKVIASCRTTEANLFIATFNSYDAYFVNIPKLDSSQIKLTIKKYPILKKYASNEKYSFILSNPLYLDILISNYDPSCVIDSESDFRKYIFDNIICLKKRLEQLKLKSNDVYSTVMNIVKTRALNFVPGVNKSIFDSRIIDALISNDVLIEQNDLIRLKFDMFEDICFEKIFDEYFTGCKGDYNLFFDDVKKYGRCGFRRYQIWFQNKIKCNDYDEEFVYKIIVGKEVELEWRRQTIIAIVKSEYCESFFTEYFDAFDSETINEFVNCINLFAHYIDSKSRLFKSSGKSFVLLSPFGNGRSIIIKHLYKNDIYKSCNKSMIISLCSDYSRSNHIYTNDESSDYCCKILISYFEQLNRDSCDKSKIKELLKPIYSLSKYCKDWIISLWNEMSNIYLNNGSDKSFAEMIYEFTYKPENTSLIINCFEEVKSFLNCFWLNEPKKIKRDFFYHEDDEYNFSEGFYLNNKVSNFMYNVNPLQSSFMYFALIMNFSKTLDWIIELFNSIVNNTIQKGGSYDKIRLLINGAEKEFWFSQGFLSLGFVKYSRCKFISDIIYSLVSAIDTYDGKEALIVYDCLKRKVFEKANNALLFEVLVWVGVVKLPRGNDYCIELCSSLEVIFDDIRRYKEMEPSFERNKLEDLIMASCGIYDMQNLYKRDNFDALRNYLYNYQLFNPDYSSDTNNKLSDIFLYLNKKSDEEEKQVVKALEVKNYFALNSPEEKQVEETCNPETLFSSVMKKAQQEGLNEEIYDEMLSVYDKLPSQNTLAYQEFYVYSLTGILSLKEVDINKKIDAAEKLLNLYNEVIFNRQTLTSNGILVKVLFDQIIVFEKYDIANKIKKLILDIILLGDDTNRTIGEMKKAVSSYFDEENQLPYLNALAHYALFYVKEQEIIYKKLYSKKLIDKKEYIDGISKPIRLSKEDYKKYGIKNITNALKEKIDDIIYLNKYDWSYEDVDSSFNIGILLKTFSVDFLITNPHVHYLFDKLFGYLENYNLVKYHQEYHNLSSFEYYVSNSFSKSIDYFKYMFDAVFNNLSFEKLNENNIKMYDNFFLRFCTLYFDSYKDNKLRNELKNKITYVENKIQNDPKLKLKDDILLCPLVPYPGDFIGWEKWDECCTDYSYPEKIFIVELYKKYGYLNFRRTCKSMFMMKYEKLLPEMVEAFEEIINKSIEYDECVLKKELETNYSFFTQFISEVYVNNCVRIQRNHRQFECFKNILTIMINEGVTEAAVILESILDI